MVQVIVAEVGVIALAATDDITGGATGVVKARFVDVLDAPREFVEITAKS